jgi:hypothetical protein
MLKLSQRGVKLDSLDGIVLISPISVRKGSNLRTTILLENGFSVPVFNVVLQANLPAGCKYFDRSARVVNSLPVKNNCFITPGMVKWVFAEFKPGDFVEVCYDSVTSGEFLEAGKIVSSVCYFDYNVDSLDLDLSTVAKAKNIYAAAVIS